MCTVRRDAFRKSVRFNIDINIIIISGVAHHVEKNQKIVGRQGGSNMN